MDNALAGKYQARQAINCSICGVMFQLATKTDLLRAATASGGGGGGFSIGIGAAAFQPSSNNVAYSLSGSFLSTGQSSASFYAPVSLPEGAVLSIFVFYYYDDHSSADGTCQLKATDVTTYGTVNISDSVSSSGSGGTGYNTTTTFNISNVDNSRYIYFAECQLHHLNPNNVSLMGVQIIYSYPTYLPLTMR